MHPKSWTLLEVHIIFSFYSCSLSLYRGLDLPMEYLIGQMRGWTIFISHRARQDILDGRAVRYFTLCEKIFQYRCQLCIAFLI